MIAVKLVDKLVLMSCCELKLVGRKHTNSELLQVADDAGDTGVRS